MLIYTGTWYRVDEKSPPRDKKILWYSNLSGVSIIGYADDFLMSYQDYWTYLPVSPVNLLREANNNEIDR